MNCVNCNQKCSKMAPLAKCENCGSDSIDQYYQFDYSLLLLDMTLCKVEVYRHILINRYNECSSKFVICQSLILFALYVLLELFYKYQANILSSTGLTLDWKEVSEYTYQTIVVILGQIIITFTCCALSLRIMSLQLLCGLILSHFGRLSIIMFVIWDHSQFYKTMATLSILLSQLSVIRALGEQGRNWIKSSATLIISIAIQKSISEFAYPGIPIL